MNSASLIIPTYNKGGRLALTLQSFCFQKTKVPFEIILVDTGEESNQEALKYKDKLPIRIIRAPHRGRSATRNYGASVANGDLLIFCDDDLIVEPSYIESHFQSHQNSSNVVVHGWKNEIPYFRFHKDPRNPDLGISDEYKGQQLSKTLKQYQITEEDIEFNFEKIRALGHCIDRLERIIREMYSKGIGKYMVPWLSSCTANMSILKSLFIEVGMFQESFGYEWGPEDLEFGYRLYKSGGAFSDAPKAQNYHISHARQNWSSKAQKGFRFFQEMYPEDGIINKVTNLLVHQTVELDYFLKLEAEDCLHA